MPRLDESLFRGQLPRTGGPRPGGGSAPLPQARQVGGGGFGALGQTLEALGRNLAGIDERFVRAKEQTLALEALQAFATESDEQAFAVTNDPDIFPSDRAAAYEQQMGLRFEALQANLPIGSQPLFVRAAGATFRKTTRDLRIQGYKDTVRRSVNSYEQSIESLQRSLLTATNSVDRAEAVSGMQLLTKSLVEQGIFTPEEGATRFAQIRNETAKLQLEILMETNPEAALAQLQEGLQGNPSLLAADLAPLTGKAMERMDKQLTRESAAERRQEKRLAEIQDTNASELRIKLTEPTITSADLLALRSEANDLRQDGDLSEGDHAEFLRTVETKLEKIQDGREEDEEASVATSLALRIHTAGSRQALDTVLADVTNAQGALGFSTVSTLLTRIGQQRERTYFTNRPNYQEGMRIMSGVSGAFPSGMVAIMMDSFDNATKSKMRVMLDTYRDQMERIYERDGLGVGDERAVPLARELRNAFFPLAPQVSDPVLPASLDVTTQPFSTALEKLEAMDVTENTKAMYYEIMENAHVEWEDAVKAKAQGIEREIRTPAPGFFQRFFGGRETPQ